MGTDIHPMFQRRTPAGWEQVETKYEGGRNYGLFAWLADVRNGYGFAGIPTFEPITPIAPQRGVPDDLGVKVGFNEEAGEVWLGEHSFSWLTAREILDAAPPNFTKQGVIAREEFDAWDGKQPAEWCGDISGPGVRTWDIARGPVPEWATHVRVYWKKEGSEMFHDFLAEVRRLQSEHGEVRMVFGFDS